MVRNTLSLFALFTIVFSVLGHGQSLPFKDVSHDQIRQLATDKQQPYLIYLFKHDSKEHRKMLRKTWANKQVRKYLASHYQVGRVNVFSGKKDARLVQKYQVFKLPTTLVFTPEGNLIGKIQGYAASASLRSILEKHDKFVAERQNISLPSPAQIASKSSGQEENTATRRKIPATRSTSTSPSTIQEKEQAALVAQAAPVTRSGNSITTKPKQVSRGQANLHLDVPGMREYSLINLPQKPSEEQSLGLLIGSYTSYKQLRQMVTRFQKVWKGDMWVFAEEVNQIPVYKLVLGDYSTREEAEIFAHVIYKIDKSNPSILDLNQLVN